MVAGQAGLLKCSVIEQGWLQKVVTKNVRMFEGLRTKGWLHSHKHSQSIESENADASWSFENDGYSWAFRGTFTRTEGRGRGDWWAG